MLILFNFIAEEVREILSELGFKSLNEIIGRTDLLRQVSKASANLDDLRFKPTYLSKQIQVKIYEILYSSQGINSVPDTLDQDNYYLKLKNEIGQK